MADHDARLIRNCVEALAVHRPFKATDSIVKRCIAAYRSKLPPLPQDKREHLIDALVGVLEEVEANGDSPAVC